MREYAVKYNLVIECILRFWFHSRFWRPRLAISKTRRGLPTNLKSFILRDSIRDNQNKMIRLNLTSRILRWQSYLQHKLCSKIISVKV